MTAKFLLSSGSAQGSNCITKDGKRMWLCQIKYQNITKYAAKCNQKQYYKETHSGQI